MNFLKNFFLLIITILFISNFNFSNEKNYFLSNKIKRVNDALIEEEIYENYEIFSRRDFIEDTNVFYNTNNLATQSSNDNASKQTIYKGKIIINQFLLHYILQ